MRVRCCSTSRRWRSALGRAAPVVRWGPRLIDLDLLVHGATRIAEPDDHRAASGARRTGVRAGATG